MNFHTNRIARAARFIAARLDNEEEVILTLPKSWANVGRLDRIIDYMNRYCGKFFVKSSTAWNYIIVRKWS